MIGENVFLSFEEKQKRTPKKHGHWEGVRGDSIFHSDKPELKAIGAESITYINGEPDFTPFSKYVINLPSMTDDRFPYSSEQFWSNFEQAYKILAEKLQKTESDVRKWLKEEHYTIHESNDLTTVYIVPTLIHKTYIHAGGVAECKCFLRDEEDDSLIELVEAFKYN